METVSLVGTLCAEIQAYLGAPEATRAFPLATAQALRLPALPPAGVSPADLLMLCDKCFALLDVLDLAEGERQARKRVIEECKRAERQVEAWKASLPPPLVLERAPIVEAPGSGAGPAAAESVESARGVAAAAAAAAAPVLPSPAAAQPAAAARPKAATAAAAATVKAVAGAGAAAGAAGAAGKSAARAPTAAAPPAVAARPSEGVLERHGLGIAAALALVAWAAYYIFNKAH